MKKYLFVFIAFFSSFLAFPKSFDWDCQLGLGLGATFSRTRFSVADDFGCGDAESGGASLDCGRWGLFAAVTATVCPGGTCNAESNESSTKPGSFFVSPRLGVAFRF